MSYKVGDKVQWTSQAQGRSKQKKGIVAEVVSGDARPSKSRFPQLYKGCGVGFARGHESYVILVGHKPYWPRVSQLSPTGTKDVAEAYRRAAFKSVGPLLNKLLSMEEAWSMLQSPPWPSLQELKDAHRQLKNAMVNDAKTTFRT